MRESARNVDFIVIHSRFYGKDRKSIPGGKIGIEEVASGDDY